MVCEALFKLSGLAQAIIKRTRWSSAQAGRRFDDFFTLGGDGLTFQGLWKGESIKACLEKSEEDGWGQWLALRLIDFALNLSIGALSLAVFEGECHVFICFHMFSGPKEVSEGFLVDPGGPLTSSPRRLKISGASAWSRANGRSAPGASSTNRQADDGSIHISIYWYSIL